MKEVKNVKRGGKWNVYFSLGEWQKGVKEVVSGLSEGCTICEQDEHHFIILLYTGGCGLADGTV